LLYLAGLNVFCDLQVEEAKAVLESERSRHTRAKDDLAMSLRVARKKAEVCERVGKDNATLRLFEDCGPLLEQLTI